MAVLRGLVTTRDGSPLPGVTIRILGHPEFGQTRSREDGMFDMAVNGGGYLVVHYRKSGYFLAQRKAAVPWSDYAWVPNVILVQQDDAVTAVNLTGTAYQVARGSVVDDADGTRQATLLVPPGTTASRNCRPRPTTRTASRSVPTRRSPRSAARTCFSARPSRSTSRTTAASPSGPPRRWPTTTTT
ncbi:MAG: hypothetical protein ACYS9X_17835 [Planctomycetota bacterium]